MDPITIFSILIALGVGMTIMYFLRSTQKPTDDTGLKLILQQINELNRTVDSKIGESSRNMNESVRTQLSESANLIREVTKRFDQTGRNKSSGCVVCGPASESSGYLEKSGLSRDSG